MASKWCSARAGGPGNEPPAVGPPTPAPGPNCRPVNLLLAAALSFPAALLVPCFLFCRNHSSSRRERHRPDVPSHSHISAAPTTPPAASALQLRALSNKLEWITCRVVIPFPLRGCPAARLCCQCCFCGWGWLDEAGQPAAVTVRRWLLSRQSQGWACSARSWALQKQRRQRLSNAGVLPASNAY